jgi:hypothetical protein
MSSKATFVSAASALAVLAALPAPAHAASKYGCFKVTVPSLNLRARPYSSAEVVGVAHRGEILEKRKMFCTPRGFWCAIRKGSLDAYADKSNMLKIDCP